jgi:histidine phosphotransfer protein HptB
MEQHDRKEDKYSMDIKTLAEKIGFEEDEYLELLELFLETSVSDLNKIQTALDQQDPKKVSEAAHSIKGASGNMGLEAIYELSKRIEMDARDKVLDGTSERIAAINDEFEKLSKLLQ